MVIILGIDPGMSGAIAMIDTMDLCRAVVEDMPVADGNVSPSGLAHILAEKAPCHAFVEAVHSMPKQGVSSTFKFGSNYGIVLGVLGALGIPYTLVSPQKWKKAMGLTGDKEASRAMALRLFPELAGDLKRKKDEGRAESLMIAEYGRRIT